MIRCFAVIGTLTQGTLQCSVGFRASQGTLENFSVPSVVLLVAHL